MRYLVRVDQPLVLVAQVGRSGGTLLVRLLDGHPECHTVPYELQRMFRGMARDLVDPDAAWAALSSEKQSRRRRPFLLPRGLQRAIFDACLSERDRPAPREMMDCYFTSFFNGWLDNANLRSGPKHWVVGFEPGSTRRLDVHARVYPEGRVLSVVRDPWSWFSSARRKEPKWAEVGPALDDWCAEIRALLDARAVDPARFFLLRFSDLLGRTRETMGTLAGWLGIDFTPSLCVPTFNGVPSHARSSFRDVGTEISSAPLHRGQDLSAEEVALIDERARDLYEEAAALAADVEQGRPSSAD